MITPDEQPSRREHAIVTIAKNLPLVPAYGGGDDSLDRSLATVIYNALVGENLLDIYAIGYSPMLAALDRCLHGRHSHDRCSDCTQGWSTGNVFLTPGERVGTTLHGNPIVVPEEQGLRSNPHRWVVGGGLFL